MAKDPAFLFYSSDFLTGTLIMPFEDKGKYITILCYMHQNGRIQEETIRLLVGSVSDSLRLKFDIDKKGNWYNERLEIEIEKRQNFVESRQKNGSLGGRPKKKEIIEEKPLGYPTDNLPEDIDEIEKEDKNNKGVDFDFFWNEYDKKVGDKTKVKKKWDQFSEKDQNLILEHIPKYKMAQPDKWFRKDPQTYLNNKSWLDEIIFRSNGVSSDNLPEKGIKRILAVSEQLVNPFPK